jgi:hypothetical protein
MQKCNITLSPEYVFKDLKMIEKTRNFFFNVLFGILLKKLTVF